MTSPARTARALVVLIVVGAIVAGAIVVGLGAGLLAAAPSARAADPRGHRPLYVEPHTQAAARGPAFAAIARRSQAHWVLPRTPARRTRAEVAGYVRGAARAGRTPVLAVYGIPGRDCGGHAAGGLAGPAAYRAWIRQVAAGLRGSRALVVLEPDALSLLGTPGCAGQAAWPGLLRHAVRRLSAAGAWVYLDAGHSRWQPPAVTAARLARAGVARARGFSTNVSNFRPTAEERRYAAAVRRELRRHGVRGARYVVDTSRNGARPPDLEWCNPAWARVGAAPRLVLRGGFDGRLWVKHPGESDGWCGADPAPAGAWSDRLARGLLGR